MPSLAKRFIVLMVDTALCVFTVWLAYYLRLGEFVAISGNAVLAAITSIGMALPIFSLCGLYRVIFRYTGWPALLAVAKAITLYGCFYASVFVVIGIEDVPRTVGIIQPILLLLFVGATRALARVLFSDQYLNILKYASRPKVLIYGAGHSGRHLLSAIINNNDMQVVGFIDDDDRLQGRLLNGLPIYNPNNLINLTPKLNINLLILAMPSLSSKRRKEILAELQRVRLPVRMLPNMANLEQGRVSISDMRDLDVDDLIGREPVLPDPKLLTLNVHAKVVMVTGAGGSIGSELCRQLLKAYPSKLLLIEQSEFALYTIHSELEVAFADRETELIPILASIQDIKRLREVMCTWHPDTIYHAAAYKHVPMVEHNLTEGIKNNVFGTLHMAKVAAEIGVSNFILISSDKAVRPTNVMGASKRLAEMVLQAMETMHPATKFSMVRFGNVLTSSGSVVPKFWQQIRDGGPITLTHPEVTRFFMTITEAAQLVIQSGAMSMGGEVFILDMGESVKIIDLAKQMVELSGMSVQDEQNIDGDIKIEITGLRPGEKLYEELLIGNNSFPTSHPRIRKTQEDFIPWEDLEGKLTALEMALTINDAGLVRLMMEKLVAGYTPSGAIVDWVFMEQGAKANKMKLSKIKTI